MSVFATFDLPTLGRCTECICFGTQMTMPPAILYFFRNCLGQVSVQASRHYLFCNGLSEDYPAA